MTAALTKGELLALGRRAEDQADAARRVDDVQKYRRLMDLADAAEAASRIL